MKEQHPACGTARGIPENRHTWPHTLSDCRVDLDRADHMLQLATMALSKLMLRPAGILASDLAVIETAIDKARGDLFDVTEAFELVQADALCARMETLTPSTASRVQA